MPSTPQRIHRTSAAAALRARCIVLQVWFGYLASGCGSESDRALALAGVFAEPDAGECTPATCLSLGAQCGSAPDRCGGIVECGSCSGELTCGGAGPNQCGSSACSPRTCLMLDAQCGYVFDGCSQALDCGVCSHPLVCELNGKQNRCGCVKATCTDIGASCGTTPDGCGGFLDCGACPIGEMCGGGGPNVCGTKWCTPKTCVQLGASCGHVSDGCGSVLHCGLCVEPGFVCQGGACVCQPSNGGLEICDGIDNDCDGQVDEEEQRIQETTYTVERCCDPPSSYWCCSPYYGGSESGKPGDCCKYTETTTAEVTFSCP